MRRTVSIGAALVVFAVVSPALAQGGDQEVEGLADGPWTASMDAFGADGISVDDFDGTFSARFRARFDFTVEAGSSSGTWTSTGTNRMDGEVNTAGSSFIITSERSVTGVGEVAGDRLELAISGSTTERGEMKLTGPGIDRVVPIDNSANPDPMPPGTITITDWHCEWANGEWISTTQASLDQFGTYVFPMRGIFSALRTDLFENMPPEEAADRVDGLTDMFADFNTFVDDWKADTDTFTQITGLLTRAESVLNELRNLSECEARLIGIDNVEFWKTNLTQIVGDLIRSAADGFRLSVDQLRALNSAGLRTGAVGGGAANSPSAASAEESVRTALERILNENMSSEDCPEGGTRCLDINDDTLNALTIGDYMDWDYNIDGRTLDPGLMLKGISDLLGIETG